MRKMSAIIIGAVAATAGAEEPAAWPRFRGPDGAGRAAGSAVFPVRVEPKDLRWSADLPGGGHSSPVVWGGKVFVTAADEASGARRVLCVSLADGKTLWNTDLGGGAAYRKHKFNSFASSTPTVDARRVYVCWATPEQLTAVALDHDGKEVWRRDLGPHRSQHGFGVSPVRHGDLLILPDDQDGGGRVLALDAATGKDRWSLPRRSGNATYSTPLVRTRPDGSAEMILANWKHGITAVDPAAGKVLWEMSVFDPGRPERAIGSPIAAGDLIVGTCGFHTGQRHLVAVRPPAGPDDKPTEAWRIERAVPHIPTPLAVGGRLFLWNDQGIVTCVNPADGKTVWQQRIGGNYYGSPVAAGDRIYCVSNEGELVVIAAADECRILGRSKLGEGCQSTPAIAGGMMVVRLRSRLVAVSAEAGK